jgi:hypothetical protein
MSMRHTQASQNQTAQKLTTSIINYKPHTINTRTTLQSSLLLEISTPESDPKETSKNGILELLPKGTAVEIPTDTSYPTLLSTTNSS